jgi:Protein of unknown function (DUF4232)
MKFSSRIARRVGATAAAVSAAILIPAVALAAPGQPAAPAAAPGCTASQVTAWIAMPGGATAGSVFYQLEISNVSPKACTLFGYPGVSGVRGQSQLGSAAGRDPSHPAALITLGTGGTAHAELQVTDVANFSPSQCGMVTATGLRVFAPNDFVSHIIPFGFPACQKSGPVYLHVSRMIAGTGIPGFSH